MSEPPYSKREIDSLHNGLHTKLDTLIEEVRYTNGKVKKIIMVLIALAFYVLGVSEVGVPEIIKMFI